MEYFNMKLVLFIATMVVIMQLTGTMAQTRHIVGGSLGLFLQVAQSHTQLNWASLQTFTVNDLLVFNFTDGEDDVAEVSEAAYVPCTATSPITLATNGPTTFPLTTAGTHYYICTFRSHCQIGQKLTINVSEAASANPPPATPRTPVSPPTIMRLPPSVTTRTPLSPPNTARTPPSATPATPFAPCPRITSPSSDQSSPSTTNPGSINPPPPPSGGAPSFTAMVPSTLIIIGLVFLNY